MRGAITGVGLGDDDRIFRLQQSPPRPANSDIDMRFKNVAAFRYQVQHLFDTIGKNIRPADKRSRFRVLP